MAEIQIKKPQGALSLTTALALAFVTLMVVALLISGGVQLFFSLQTQQKVISSRQQLVAQDAARLVSSFIQEKFGVLETGAKLVPSAAASQEELEQFLQGLLVPQPAFRQLVLLNAQDQELAQSSRI